MPIKTELCVVCSHDFPLHGNLEGHSGTEAFVSSHLLIVPGAGEGRASRKACRWNLGCECCLAKSCMAKAWISAGPAFGEMLGSCPSPETSNRPGMVWG